MLAVSFAVSLLSQELMTPEKFLGYIEFKRCYVMESRDWREEMIECWRRSARMGYEGAKYQLKMMGIAE